MGNNDEGRVISNERLILRSARGRLEQKGKAGVTECRGNKETLNNVGSTEHISDVKKGEFGRI